MELLQFVKQLPSDWVLAPILRKGVGKSTGKQPLQESRERHLNPTDTALIIENNNHISAVGVWTGPKGNGIVIVDCDMNDFKLREKYPELKQFPNESDAPRISSPRENAAKYIFRVPEEMWPKVAGFGHSKTHNEGFEVLWTNQGLIYGEYPGSEKHNVPEGHYTFTGDPETVPEAPEWLLAVMRAAKGNEGWIKNRAAIRLTDRSPQQRLTMIHECLSIIPEQGPGSYEMWWRIGMAIHSELPGDEGYKQWRWWSEKDSSYEDDWDDPNGIPAEKWASFKPDGNITFGTLSYIADDYDPKRTRFSEESREAYEQERAKVVQEIRASALSYEDTVARGKEIQQLEDPAKINHELQRLATEAGYRDRSSLEAMLLSAFEYERRKDMQTWQELQQKEFKSEYLIPDVLPSQSVVVFYGAGGEGKSTTAWTIAKHVAKGIPFVVRGRHVPVKAGPVLVLNGDQPEKLVRQQLEEVDMPHDAPVFIQNNWQLKRYTAFCQLMDKIKPSMVIIDSLIGCSSGDSFDENKSEFASPLYWLTKNNGELFPGTAIVLIHHANKTGGFRGTSAIRDAVDETWALKRPSDEQVEKEPGLKDARLIHIEKSRSGRSGTSLVMNMLSDLTFSVSDFTPEIDKKKTTPDGIVDRVLTKIRVIYPRIITKEELNNDPITGGKVAGVTKALQRLEARGLITSEKEGGRYGKKIYRAVLHTRGEGGEGCPPSNNPSPGTDPRVDNEGGQGNLSTLDSEGGHTTTLDDGCPPSEASGDKESAQGGHVDMYPRAREDVDPAAGEHNYGGWID